MEACPIVSGTYASWLISRKFYSFSRSSRSSAFFTSNSFSSFRRASTRVSISFTLMRKEKKRNQIKKTVLQNEWAAKVTLPAFLYQPIYDQVSYLQQIFIVHSSSALPSLPLPSTPHWIVFITISPFLYKCITPFLSTTGFELVYVPKSLHHVWRLTS